MMVHYSQAVFLTAKTFERKYLDDVIDTIEPLYADADRYKQRAAAEMIAGVLRGSKHWKQSDREAAWNWFVRHMDAIFAQIKPDTLSFWEIAFHVCVEPCIDGTWQIDIIFAVPTQRPRPTS